MKTIRIGSGSGFSEDFVEPAQDLAERGEIDFLVFEALAERTIHEAHLRIRDGVNPGYGMLFEERMRRCVAPCLRRGIRIITNDGSANPRAAAEWLAGYLREQNLSAKIAIVEGDDVLTYFSDRADEIFAPELFQVHAGSDAWMPTDPAIIRDNISSANVYLYYEPIREALDAGADIVIAGRVADPSMFVAALAHGFDWAPKDWNRIAMGTVVGHLLECSGHTTGGYFADCETKTVSDLANIGFPIAEVQADGQVFITKLPGSGGKVTCDTVLEQLHYEVHSFSSYVTPDVIAAFRDVRVEQDGADRVRVTGFTGRERPRTLKVLLGYHHGYNLVLALRFRGHTAMKRAHLLGTVWSERLRHFGNQIMDSVYLYNDLPYAAALREDPDPKYVEFRYSAVVRTREEAEAVARAFMGFYLNGAYGGGGLETNVSRYDPLIPLTMPREDVRSSVSYLEAGQ
ncbi:acyclic terpene utilization AtuA family protein [Marinibaculum pumilum]|uniref:Acyclic terpene utilization AtuA family protein n=1 Tax=Marinibaculum pumilum TaxID=1766165 RepID=A0ABV7KVJ8_9PROT